MTNEIKVFFRDLYVGRLTQTPNKLVGFEYDDNWIEKGFSISPFSLPLKKGIFIPNNRNFNGLFGVFSDSLPDSWGRLLIKRKLSEEGIKDTSELFKLTLVNEYCMGGLTYHPCQNYKNLFLDKIDFDSLSLECQKLLENDQSNDLDYLFQQGGSSGGARPKANITLGNELYIVKFFTKIDGKNAGLMEYEYMKCAQDCGIIIPDIKLLPSSLCNGYFAVKRFDRNNGEIFTKTLPYSEE